jgi:hypothetical protein
VVVAEDLTALTKTLAGDLAAGSGRAAGAGTERAATAGIGHKVVADVWVCGGTGCSGGFLV